MHGLSQRYYSISLYSIYQPISCTSFIQRIFIFLYMFLNVDLKRKRKGEKTDLEILKYAHTIKNTIFTLNISPTSTLLKVIFKMALAQR